MCLGGLDCVSCVSDGLCVCSFVPLVVLCVFHLLKFCGMELGWSGASEAPPPETGPARARMCLWEGHPPPLPRERDCAR